MSNLKLIFIGIILGVAIFLKPIFLLLSLLLGILVIFLLRINPDERAMLAKIVFTGLVLRLLFSLLSISFIQFLYFDYSEHPFLKNVTGVLQLFRDFYREILNGVNLGRYFAGGYGEIGKVSLTEVAVEGRATYLHLGSYFQGFLNFIFGESLLNVFVYPLLGIWAIILVYYLAKEIFGRNVAVLTSFILATLPSFIIWDCINIRMSLSIISILIIIWSSVKFGKNNHIKYLIPFFVALWVFNLAKNKFTMPSIVISIFVLFLNINLNRSIKKILIILIIVAGLMLIKGNIMFQSKIHNLILNTIMNQISFYRYESGNNYKIYEDFVYSEDIYNSKRISAFTLLKGLPKGIAYFLFAPFPWETTNTLRLYSYPQIIFWYFMFPFSIWGIIIGFRNKRKDTRSLLTFSLFWIILLSLIMGNEGTAARHRDFISPFFYIFSSAALCNLLGLLKIKEKP